MLFLTQLYTFYTGNYNGPVGIRTIEFRIFAVIKMSYNILILIDDC